MGPIWGRQVPGGPHVGPMHFAIWEVMLYREAGIESVPHTSPPQYETLRPFMVIYGVIYVWITTRINSKSNPCDVVFDRYKLVWSKKMPGKYQYGVGYIENFDFSRPDLTSDKKNGKLRSSKVSWEWFQISSKYDIAESCGGEPLLCQAQT